MEIALERVNEGAGLTEALADADKLFPPFFLPVIWAGEQTGRLDDSLRYLEHHCKSLAGPAQVLRNAWLVPLCLIVAGSLIKLLAHLWFGTLVGTLLFVKDSLINYAFLAGAATLVIAPPFKPLFDRLKLQLPLLGTVERELAANRFFQVLAMLYCAAGHRLEKMIQLSAQTVSNIAMRRDLLMAAAEIKRKSTITEAFEAPTQLSREQKDTIAAGELAGKLDEVFERISTDAGESLSFRLKVFSRVFVRLTAALVALSILQTVHYLLLMSVLR